MRNWKKLWVGLAVLFATVLVIAPLKEVKAQPGVSVSFQMFYDQLAPYGSWIQSPSYGYVWTPRGVGRDFRPYYSGGRWAMTEYGNTWVSDYQWGWAPYHYGRWAYDDYYGWIWIPDTEWGPAWVTWRDGGGYYGWAPMGPGININVSFGPNYYVPNDWWTFVPCNRIYSPRFRDYYRGPRYNTTIINNTTVINNTYNYDNRTYVSGPRSDEYQRRTGQRPNTYKINNVNQPGRTTVRNSNTINMYRPSVQNAHSNERPAQATVARQNALRGNSLKVPTTNGRTNQVSGNRASQPQVQRQPVQQNNANRQMEQANAQRIERQRPGQQQSIEQRRQQTWESQRQVQPAQQQRGFEQRRQAQQVERQRNFERQRQAQEQQATQQKTFEQQRQAQPAQRMERQQNRSYEQRQVQPAQRSQPMHQNRGFEQRQMQSRPQAAPVQRAQPSAQPGGRSIEHSRR